MKDVLKIHAERESSAGGARDTRAAFLRKSAIGGGALVGGSALVAALPASARADTASDIRVLNYALTLEHLEATFYTQGLRRFSRGDITGTKLTSGLGGQIRSQLYDNLVRISEHEQVHVQTLTNVILSLDGTPVPPCTYNFAQTAFGSVTQFLKVAQALENTGVMAYDGAIHLLNGTPTTPTGLNDLLTAGATIATVEARHASYLNLINGDVPFPDAFDTPKLPSEICAIAAQFIVSCDDYELPSLCTP